MSVDFLDTLLQKDKPYITLNESICLNIKEILNTRRGSLTHMPNYGLPDLTPYYKNAPSSLTTLCELIKNTIDEYEPRAKVSYISSINDEDGPNQLKLFISLSTHQSKPLTLCAQLNGSQEITINER